MFDFHAWVKKCQISLSEKLPKWIKWINRNCFALLGKYFSHTLTKLRDKHCQRKSKRQKIVSFHFDFCHDRRNGFRFMAECEKWKI